MLSVLLVLLASAILSSSPTGRGATSILAASAVGDAGAPAVAPTSSLFPFPVHHVILVILENAELSTVLSKGPFEEHLVDSYASANHDYAVCHPSAPNYLALTSGSHYTQCGTDAYHVYKAKNLGDVLDSAGRTWGAFEQSMPKPCDTSDSYPYAVKHNPFVFYADIVHNATRCDAHDLPFSAWNHDVSIGRIPNFALIVPNLKNDGHDTGVAYADAWLKGWLSPLLNATWFASTAILITYDEGSSNHGFNGLSGGNVFFAAVSPYARLGLSVTTNVSHYNVLTTIEWLLGLASTGHNDSAAKYPPLKALFRFP